MLQFLTRFAQNDDGATAIEYGLIVALIAVAILTAVSALGGRLETVFDDAKNGMDGIAPS